MAKKDKAPKGAIGMVGPAGPNSPTGPQGPRGAAFDNAAMGGTVVIDKLDSPTPTIAPFANTTAYEAATGTKAPTGGATGGKGGAVVPARKPKEAGIVTQATGVVPAQSSTAVAARKSKPVSTNGGKALADGDLAKESIEAVNAAQYAQSQYQAGYDLGQSTQASQPAVSTQGSTGGLLSSFSNLGGAAKLFVLVIAGAGGFVLYRRSQQGKPLFGSAPASSEGEM